MSTEDPKLQTRPLTFEDLGYKQSHVKILSERGDSVRQFPGLVASLEGPLEVGAGGAFLPPGNPLGLRAGDAAVLMEDIAIVGSDRIIPANTNVLIRAIVALPTTFRATIELVDDGEPTGEQHEVHLPRLGKP